MIDTLCYEYNVEKPRTYRRNARKDYLALAKRRKRSGKVIRKAVKQQLKAGITDSKEVDEILDRPCDYIDSELYFSWERFFTDLLIKHSQGKVYSYNRRSIAVYYLSDRSAKRILEPFFDDI